MPWSPAWSTFDLLRRRREAAFWQVSADRLVVAVLRVSVGEPLLTACASLEARAIAGGFTVAPGVRELAVQVGAAKLRHIVALDDRHCLLLRERDGDESSAIPASSSRMRVPLAGDRRLACEVDADVVCDVRDRFAQSGLRVARIDCAPCARIELATFLDRSDETGPREAGRAVSTMPVDALAAVSVESQTERAASLLGELLVVPVGLALGWFGYVDPTAVVWPADLLERRDAAGREAASDESAGAQQR